jgi:hypothetical protein
MQRWSVVVRVGIFASLVASLLVAGGSPASAAVEKPFHAMIRDLPVAKEVRAGYDRDKFDHWIDADGDCFDTRAEVLQAESQTKVTYNDNCTIISGKWFSWYDGATWTYASDVDIDHLVALAEAWDSGARRWTAGTRERYANDLGDGRSLVAVTDNVNQAKGDQDPDEWLRERNKCAYLRYYVAVKVRWRLTVNWNEKAAIRDFATRHCANTIIRVTRAKVVYS